MLRCKTCYVCESKFMTHYPDAVTCGLPVCKRIRYLTKERERNRNRHRDTRHGKRGLPESIAAQQKRRRDRRRANPAMRDEYNRKKRCYIASVCMIKLASVTQKLPTL